MLITLWTSIVSDRAMSFAAADAKIIFRWFKRLSDFVILCVLCLQRQSFFFYFTVIFFFFFFLSLCYILHYCKLLSLYVVPVKEDCKKKTQKKNQKKNLERCLSLCVEV